MKILAKLEKSFDCWFLIIVSFVFFLLRLPSLFEPDWYGDEGIYQVLGMGIKAGRLLYRDIFDNKPPLLYLLYSFVSSDLFSVKLLSLVFGLLSVWAFFFLAKKLLNKPKIVYFSTALFAVLFGLPLIEGNIANAENFMLPLNILGGYLVLKSLERKAQNTKYVILLTAGLVVGLSFLFKIVAVFDFAAFAGFLFFANYAKKLLDIFKPKHLLIEIKNLSPFILGFLIPLVLTVLFFVFKHAFANFLTATLSSNVGYVGYGNKLIIPQGLLILKLALLAVFSLFIFYKRKAYGNAFSFVALWLAFSLFNAYFSQRPYTHYVLVILPSFCLLIGLFLLNKHFSKLAGTLAIASFIAVLLSFTFYVKTIFYYQNFISFVVDGKSVYAYQSFFDGSTPRDYEIAGYLNSHALPTDNLFIWGNNAQVYYLTQKLPPGKYTATYHITLYKDGYSNTLAGLRKKQPKFIVIMPNVSAYPFSLAAYNQVINIQNVPIYEKLNQ